MLGSTVAAFSQCPDVGASPGRGLAIQKDIPNVEHDDGNEEEIPKVSKDRETVSKGREKELDRAKS